MTEPENQRRAKRIVIVSRANGTSSLLVGVLVLVVSASVPDWRAVAGACGLCAGAAVELLGSGLAVKRDRRTRGVLVASQGIALVSVLILTLHALAIFSPAGALEWMPQSLRTYITSRVPDPDSARTFVSICFNASMACLALTAIVFEGFMAFFYNSAGRALHDEARPPPPVLKS